VHNEGRLTKPLIKKNGKFQEVSWDEALTFTAKRMLEIKEKTGPDSFGFLSSAKCTNEENYLLMKLSRGVMGTNNVDHCARL
jgi:predicted molibdopterin-dependent oxidoreductase YjgC